MMVRECNTDISGNSWSEEVIIHVWIKGEVIPRRRSSDWRRDICGVYMKFSEFGNRDSICGWEIDHIIPVVHGGLDDISNLQPLHWENNANKGDQLDWDCPR